MTDSNAGCTRFKRINLFCNFVVGPICSDLRISQVQYTKYKSIEIGCDCVNHFLGTTHIHSTHSTQMGHTRHTFILSFNLRNMCTFGISKYLPCDRNWCQIVPQAKRSVYLLAEEITSSSSSSSSPSPSSMLLSSPKFHAIELSYLFRCVSLIPLPGAFPFTFRENPRCQFRHRRRRRLSIYLLYIMCAIRWRSNFGTENT